MNLKKGIGKKELSEQEQLEKKISDTLAEIRTIEARDIDDMDMGRLGWLNNHVDVLRNRLNGTLKDKRVWCYEILE